MTPASAVGFRGSKRTAESTFLDILPVELRLKIYEFFYADLISELSDNLFGVFSLYDFLYDYTRSSLESHVGKTGLTTLLYTCKQVRNEALQVLCNETEFVLNIMGDDDGNDEERAEFRFSEDSRLLEFAKNLKVNLEPLSDGTNERLVKRIHRLSETINHGVNLRSLKIRVSGPNIGNPQSLDDMLLALSTLKTAGNRIEVYIGEVAEEVLSTERLVLFVDTINGQV
ncbi:hypothetical protein E0Z10_g1327 [Xylaria hypoxylon]|uniref:F-box domain-containing protein n=1 Tax=Xylaria hypoxylon TaxID=37992 RepID=A0A4Z0Z8W6_9PEZI|nr:hypothetical protein E0Z10_g1327 [Xylaria hypoxylon]